MKDFLRKIRLIDVLVTEIEIDKTDFVRRLKAHVDEGDIGAFAETLDAFKASDNDYKGRVGYQDFKIKRRKRLFDRSNNFAVATGTYLQRGDTLVITTEINGFRKIMLFFYVFILLFYLLFLVIFFNGGLGSEFTAIFLPFFILHAALMFSIPYIMMRRGVRNMKRELEREFVYISSR